MILQKQKPVVILDIDYTLGKRNNMSERVFPAKIFSPSPSRKSNT